jgi:methylglutaconyl-CoA hydratase
LNSDLIGRLREQLARHAELQSTRVIIIRAAGAAFCSGLDLRSVQAQGQRDWSDNEAACLDLAALLRELREFSKPTIAAVQGPAFGAGAGIVTACDVAFGAEEAKFCFPETRLGLVPALISPYVVAAIGDRHARRYLLSGEMVSSERAREIGLLNEVVPVLALGGEALRCATELALGGPEAVSITKKMLRTITLNEAGADRDSALSRILAERCASEEGQAGLAAMLARQAPPWAP